MRALDRDDPREIGGYRILRVLGAGGMGRVYLARSRGGRTVAVKMIRPELADDQGFRNLFRREVAAARRVGGAWTAPVIDADTESPRPWLVTGYVAGPSVYEAVERHGPLPESSVRILGGGLAEALIAIHGTGLIHRDLKPTNVLLSLDGPRVIDFGISRALDASVHTRTGATVGSPGFMSPEQIDGRDVGPATDVFSLGSVLVFAATAEGPFGAGSGQALMFRIVSKTPELGAVPASLRDLISACLAKYAGNRPTPEELLAQLAPNGGTATLVAPGWLPGPLTTDLSRRAIALLEIDELAPDGTHAGPTTDGTPDPGPSVQTSPTQPPSAYAATEPAAYGSVRTPPPGVRTPPPMPSRAPVYGPPDRSTVAVPAFSPTTPTGAPAGPSAAAAPPAAAPAPAPPQAKPGAAPPQQAPAHGPAQGPAHGPVQGPASAPAHGPGQPPGQSPAHGPAHSHAPAPAPGPPSPPPPPPPGSLVAAGATPAGTPIPARTTDPRHPQPAPAAQPPVPPGSDAALPPPAGKDAVRRGTPWLYVSAVAAAISIVTLSAFIARSGSGSDADEPTPNTPTNSVPQNTGSPQATAPTQAGPSTGTPNGTATPQGTAAVLPAEYQGTWSGTITSQMGVQSDFTITLHPIDAAGMVGNTTAHAGGNLVQGDCTSDAKLTSVGGDGVSLLDVANNKPQPTFMGNPACAFGGKILLRLDKPGGTTMKIEITNSGGGNPTGTLTRK